MIYPYSYEWLGKIGILPKVLSEAIREYGTVEASGVANNPKIMAWAKETGLDAEGYTADSVPWCGLFAAVVAQRAGYQFPKHPLWALNWGQFGQKAYQPILGSILTFVRDGGGHVGFYVAEDLQCYHVLGGNTSDTVKIARIEKTRLKAVREPIYKIGRPTSAKPYIVAANGAISRNEK